MMLGHAMNLQFKNKRMAFGRQEGGNVAIIAALVMLPIIALVGFAVDFRLAVTKKGTVQNIVDAAVLAGAKSLQDGNSVSTVRSDVQNYFDVLVGQRGASLDCDAPGIVVVPEEEQIDISVSCRSGTTLSGIMGYDEIAFTADSASTYGVNNVDVAFVFDLSGSMNSNNRLNDLKDAAEIAFDELLPDDAPRDGSLRISLAGYSGAVDVSNIFEDVVHTVEVDQVSNSIDSGDAQDLYNDLLPGGASSTQRFHYEEVAVQQTDSVEEQETYEAHMFDRLIDSDSGNRFFYFEDREAECTRWNSLGTYCRSQDTYWRFQRRDLASGRNESTCVFGRQGVNAFTDAAPSGNSRNENNTQGWMNVNTPYWIHDDDFFPGSPGRDSYDNKLNGEYEAESGGANSTNSNGLGSFYGNGLTCQSTGEPLPLTENKAQLTKYVNDMRAGGWTSGHVGVAWGWYLISPKWKDIWPASSTPREYDEEDSFKVVILMSDGNFNTYHTGSEKNATDQAAAICDNMNSADNNIRIFTVAFQVPNNVDTVTGSDKTVMEYCASNPDFAFEADSGAELEEVYRDIARNISNLRLRN